MKSLCPLSIGLLLWVLSVSVAAAEPGKFTLRYKFRPGETLRWDVVHRSRIETTVSGATQTAETTSKSVKVWRVIDVRPDGTATFEHSVESIDMRQKLTGSAEVCYNSRTDKKPPPGFEHVAQAVGVPLSIVTMDRSGKVLKRRRKPVKAAASNNGRMTIPLPDRPIAVGGSWSFPHTVDVKLNNGAIKKIETLQRFTLLGVKTGVAAIRVSTAILTPIHDPAVESQLIQCQSAGTVRFDIDAGRVLRQQMDLDKAVVGFRGEASSLHYLTRFTEQLLPAVAKTAEQPPREQR